MSGKGSNRRPENGRAVDRNWNLIKWKSKQEVFPTHEDHQTHNRKRSPNKTGR